MAITPLSNAHVRSVSEGADFSSSIQESVDGVLEITFNWNPKIELIETSQREYRTIVIKDNKEKKSNSVRQNSVEAHHRTEAHSKTINNESFFTPIVQGVSLLIVAGIIVSVAFLYFSQRIAFLSILAIPFCFGVYKIVSGGKEMVENLYSKIFRRGEV